MQTEGPTLFEDEVSTMPQEITAISAPVLSEEPIFPTNSAMGRSTDIADLCTDGIENDDEDPAPKNAIAEPRPVGQVGEWEKQLVYPRRNNSAITDTVGRWNQKSWPTIATMVEFAVFHLCFPEVYIKATIITMTNIHLKGDQLTLQEFHVWLGCQFYMACFVGEHDTRACCWSVMPVLLWEGAPHCLNVFIEHDGFEDISRALRLTDMPPPTPLDTCLSHRSSIHLATSTTQLQMGIKER